MPNTATALQTPTPAGDSDLSTTPEVLAEMPRVHYIARRIHERLPQHVELADLVSAGVIGLLDAFRKFDGEQKVQFSTYAQWRIRGAILDALRENDWSPRDLRQSSRRIQEAISVLSTRLGRQPEENEIAGEMGIPIDEYYSLLGEISGLEMVSLDAPAQDDPGRKMVALEPVSQTEDALAACIRHQDVKRAAAAIERLPEREKLVLSLYYKEELAMKEIATVLEVGESRVSQLHTSAIARLRSIMASPTQTPQQVKKRGHRTAAKKLNARRNVRAFQAGGFDAGRAVQQGVTR